MWNLLEHLRDDYDSSPNYINMYTIILVKITTAGLYNISILTAFHHVVCYMRCSVSVALLSLETISIQ